MRMNGEVRAESMGVRSSLRKADSIRVAVAGVGSCCSSFTQLIELAKKRPNELSVTGISHPYIGGHQVEDISLVAAFDIDATKVGKDLADAIAVNDAVLHVPVNRSGITVQPGPVLDGVDGPVGRVIAIDPRAQTTGASDVVGVLSRQAAEVVICSVPSGAKQAVRFYAEAAAKAGAAFINCTAAPAAHDASIAAMFDECGVPLLGDDLRSHVGATTVHTMLLELFSSRGIEILNTYQLNVGGNRDFLNLSDPSRSEWKVASKKRALHASAAVADDVWAGPNGFIPTLGDRKICHLMIEGRSALNSSISIELKLQVEDSPNAASVMVNAVRVAAIERRRGTKGVVEMPAGYLFKSPTTAVSPFEAESRFAQYVSDMAT